MIDAANFIVRKSGKKAGFYYIDYLGQYKITDISKEVRIEALKLTAIYLENGGIIDRSLDVYYFDDFLKAKKVISEITSKITPVNKGKNILFTEAEIAQIRKALINDSGNFGVDSKIKDKILNKLNG
jgi:metal-dependent HD superfamily phosphatase/phosphodiesterase